MESFKGRQVDSPNIITAADDTNVTSEMLKYLTLGKVRASCQQAAQEHGRAVRTLKLVCNHPPIDAISQTRVQSVQRDWARSGALLGLGRSGLRRAKAGW